MSLTTHSTLPPSRAPRRPRRRARALFAVVGTGLAVGALALALAPQSAHASSNWWEFIHCSNANHWQESGTKPRAESAGPNGDQCHGKKNSNGDCEVTNAQTGLRAVVTCSPNPHLGGNLCMAGVVCPGPGGTQYGIGCSSLDGDAYSIIKPDGNGSFEGYVLCQDDGGVTRKQCGDQV